MVSGVLLLQIGVHVSVDSGRWSRVGAMVLPEELFSPLHPVTPVFPLHPDPEKTVSFHV